MPWGTGAGPDPVNPGQKLTYKILVTNNATGNNSRADDVVVRRHAGARGGEHHRLQTIVNGTVGTTGGCVVIRAAGAVLDQSRSTRAAHSRSRSPGTSSQSAGSTIFNTATVTGNIKNKGVTSTDSEVTTVRPPYDLTITKADKPDPVCARSWPTARREPVSNQHLLAPGVLLAARVAPTPLVAPRSASAA